MVLDGMAGYNHLLTTIFSAMRDRMAVTEIGRNSPIEAGLVTLGTGVTTANYSHGLVGLCLNPALVVIRRTPSYVSTHRRSSHLPGRHRRRCRTKMKKKKKKIHFANSKHNTNIMCKHRGGFPEGQSPIVLDTLSNAEYNIKYI